MVDIFISFKNTYEGKLTPEVEVAQRIYDKLTSMGLNVFMMNESLKKLGAANFKKSIDKALDEAKCLIVLGSRKEFFVSDWVQYEWDTFLNEVLSGRKADNLFTFRINGLEISQLPISLRKYQSFTQEIESNLYIYLDSLFNKKETSESNVHRYIYPAVFTKNLETLEYDVFFPDLKISTTGEIVEEGFLYAKDFLEQYLIMVNKYNYIINMPSEYSKVYCQYPDSIVMLIEAEVNLDDL